MEESKKSVQIMAKDIRERKVLTTSPKREMTKSLIRVSFVSSILSVHYGYFIWIVYSPGALLQKFFNNTSFEHSTTKYEVLELAVNIAIIPLGGIFASVMAGFLADILGRKCSLVIANITAMISAILMSGQLIINSLEFTFFSHLFTGLSAGFILSLVPLYVGEIAPRNYRGAIIFIHQFCLNIGILLSQIFAVSEFLGNKSGWSILMGLAGVLPLIQLFLLPCIPETPSYLMIYKKNEQQARKVLQRLREREDVDDEMEELYQEDLAEGNNKNMTPLKLIRTQSMRLQIITIVVITAGSQLNGITLAYFSTERIYLMMPMKYSNLKYINSASIILMSCCVLVGMYLIDSVGRRPFLLWGFTIYIIATILLMVSLHLQKTVKALSYFTSVVLFIFICAHDLAAAPLPHLLTLELFSQSSRASAFVIAGSVFWSISFITGISYFFIESQMKDYSSVIFWPFSIGTLIYIYKMVPETTRQTFPEIKRIMSMKTAKKFRSRESRRNLNLRRRF